MTGPAPLDAVLTSNHQRNCQQQKQTGERDVARALSNLDQAVRIHELLPTSLNRGDASGNELYGCDIE